MKSWLQANLLVVPAPNAATTLAEVLSPLDRQTEIGRVHSDRVLSWPDFDAVGERINDRIVLVVGDRLV